MTNTAIAIAHPNIAFIKYWGNADEALRIPANGSISMNLDGLITRTRVSWAKKHRNQTDSLLINDVPIFGSPLKRVTDFLDIIREMTERDFIAEVVSENNFPLGTGIASSSSAFASLALAASRAAGLDLDRITLSRLARRGSGSACRSIPGGFVEWIKGTCDEESYAISIAPEGHWDLVDIIAIISDARKTTGSTEGHNLARTSIIQNTRVNDSIRRLSICRKAILEQDFQSLIEVIELDSNLMHAVMMTSSPPLFYWIPETLHVIQAIRKERENGLGACTTLDAGPNVHIICEKTTGEEVIKLLGAMPGVIEVRIAKTGGPTKLIEGEAS